ncbi:DNA damage-inducible protein I [Dickeya zeae]|jgi:DNA-damage-inducible protein I|uniref:DNA damage-inducible protein I n=1 Tax=Dickeya zeae TaxID=204042 RepID=UPI000361C013|nr:DNA damage-inducible protein I [Dickeya zeae]PXW47964.1 DNA-damage-inducible protein I [Erwinia sp. AG740]AUQ25954.1 DNA damage-inducible protein I [Dickeya zeae]MCA6985226.1 DNA damage-inducible protein I [Dickeya zeae]UJR54899.1 DNA damage-inducible protein I [Dickeya zeae MS1]UJR59018.1 DNA damage-inducible protein I [Dickeya zeae]
MRIELTIAKTTLLPTGALEALTHELSHRVHDIYPDTPVSIRYAASNNLSVFGGSKDDKEKISEILQETWESAEDWFVQSE